MDQIRKPHCRKISVEAIAQELGKQFNSLEKLNCKIGTDNTKQIFRDSKPWQNLS